MLGQFLVSILTCKLPVDLLFIVIPSLGPCCNFVCQYLHILDPSVSTLDIHHINLDFGSIKPARVLWRVMELDLVQNPFCFLNAFRLVK